MRSIRACGGIVVSCVVLSLIGCVDRQLAPLSPCLVTTVHDTVSVNNVDTVDLLFMVDNSGSMKEEQAALARELPKLVRVLSSGDSDNDGVQDFRPVELRLGVVTSDMGLPGLDEYAPGCADLGDDGVLQHASNPTNNPALMCQASYPAPFLSFVPQTGPDAAAAADRVANDFACISTLGTLGCGFEQQLEASLKALWPSDHHVQGQDMRAALGQPQFQGFLPDPNTGFGVNGNGDPLGPNAGFLHNDPARGLSLIVVVVVTDEEDCSSWTTSHFASNAVLPGQAAPVPSGLTCFLAKQNLYPVQRYIDGLKALRPGQDNLVVFAAITGVEPTLVDDAALSQVDFDKPAESNAFYDRILAHSSMIEMPNAAGLKLNPSCRRTVGGVLQEAYPPRRIVEVAKGFGKNGIVQSICQDSFAPAMDRIIQIIVGNIVNVCLPRKLVRDVTGQVDCRVVWDLPPVSQVAPTTCDDPRYAGILSRPPSGRKQTTDDGKAICEVHQLPVGPCTPNGQPDDPCATGTGPSPGAEGWYYDDFSKEALACRDIDKQRVSFSVGARPPTGVVVRLECTSEVQSLGEIRSDLLNPTNSPRLGDECADNVDCAVALNDSRSCQAAQLFREDINGTCFDASMFCHATKKRCVQACVSNGDCPPGWQCDIRGIVNPLDETSNTPICVNPTCGQ